MDSKPWSNKRKARERCSLIREAKKSKNSAPDGLLESTESVSSSVSPPESEIPEDLHIDSETDYDSDPEDEFFTNEMAQERFDDFMVALPFSTRQMLGVALMENYRNRESMNVKDAAQEAASFVGFHLTTIQRYRNDFFWNKGKFNERKQGKYDRITVYRDETLNHEAAQWVREHAFVKGQPNMTAQSFTAYVNDTLLPSSFLPPNFPRQISLRTAIRWLHYLGFKPRNHKKGVYIDGHEREDVVKYRKTYLKTMEDLRKTHKPPPPCADEPPRVRNEEDDVKKQLVLLYHDESIYNCNEGQTWMWAEAEKPAILPKTKGSGVMIADFIDEHEGYLRLSDDQYRHASMVNPDIAQSARVLLEYGAERDGYFTGDRFLQQMERACDIAEFKYPPSSNTVVFILDQSSCHKKYSEQALLAKNILVKDGGPRRVRDTKWAGAHQSMVHPDGTAKGLKTILNERGINTATLRADDMRTLLSYHEDFLTEKTQVEHYVEERGFKCLFLPKFHCELNPIERVWGQSKVYCRAYTNFTLQRLREIVNPALESVSVNLIRKYYRRVREYERAYL